MAWRWCTPASRRAINRPSTIGSRCPWITGITWRSRTLHNLYLNLIDPPTPLFRVESFRHFRDFATSAYVDGRQALLIHCNQGQSRAPTLAMLFLAKDLHVLPDDSYAEAVEAFAPMAEMLPRYQPGLGIQQFMTERWSEL